MTRAGAMARVESPVDATEGREAQLLVIARRLFAHRGYDATSLREIAEEANITKAALYYYFPNKDALYERIVIESMDSLLASVKSAVARVPTPTEKVRAFLRACANDIETKRDQWVAGSNAFWQAGNIDRRNVALRQRDEFERLLRRCITEGVAQGEMRSVDPAIATRLLLAGVNQLVRWHRSDGTLTAREVIDQYLDIALLGLTSRAR
jgi:TetR/AcrR family transcriptional regulator, cholesterol catabolism regulator